MSNTHVDKSQWVFDYRSNDSNLLVEMLGLEGLELKYLRTSDARNIPVKAVKGEIPHIEKVG